MEVLLTGATGFVGHHAARALSARGHRVRCLVRPASGSADLEAAGYAVVRGQVLDQASLDAAVRGADAVVHMAGLITARSFSEMRRVNEEGVTRLAVACARAPVPPLRFLLVSSLAAAGPSRGGRPVTEDDVPRPVSRYGLTKLLGERAAARALPPSIPLTVIRPPAVYGPFDRGIFSFFEAAAHGLRLRLGTRTRRISIVHGADLADAFVRAVECDAAAGRTYFVADPQSHALDDLLGRIAAAVGGRQRSLRLPEPLVRAAGALAEEVARWRGQPPLFSRVQATEFLQEGWVCDPSRAVRELGWSPARTLDEGLADTARWYREHGWLPSAAR